MRVGVKKGKQRKRRRCKNAGTMPQRAGGRGARIARAPDGNLEVRQGGYDCPEGSEEFVVERLLCNVDRMEW